jgi:hypothetical protein
VSGIGVERRTHLLLVAMSMDLLEREMLTS